MNNVKYSRSQLSDILVEQEAIIGYTKKMVRKGMSTRH